MTPKLDDDPNQAAPGPAGDPYATVPPGPPAGHDLPTVLGAADGTAPQPGAAAPRRFGKYNLLASFDAGGMGEVFQAEELAADAHSPGRLVRVRLVALKKILRARVETPGAVERFQRETQAAKRLDHPGIVPVFESGVIDGEHYFTMPFVAGGDLDRHVRGDRLAPREAARLIRQVAEAVQFAHDHGVIHRDLKPQNILLQPNTPAAADGPGAASMLAVTPRLTDFGLARLVTEESGLSISQKGEAMGTPGYMPPEQAKGELEKVGPASDVYSLGAVLYALLTGRPPFPLQPQAPVLETLRQVVDVAPVPPRALNAGVPPELEDVCRKCLQKEPKERYATARQLAEALEDFLENRPQLRHTPRRAGWLRRTAKRLVRSARKHPLRAAYVAASTAAILALGVVLYRHWEAERRKAEDLLGEAEKDCKKAIESQKAGKRDEARDGFQSAREKYDQLIKSPRHLDPLSLHLGRAEVRWRRGFVLHVPGDPTTWPAAEAEYQAAIAELSEQEQQHPNHPKLRQWLGEAYHGLGAVFSGYKKPEELKKGLGYYRKALPYRTALSEQFPDDLEYKRDLARNYGFMGDTQLELWDWAAKASYDEASKIRAQILREAPASQLVEASCQRARDFLNLGYYHEWMREPKKALDEYRNWAGFYKAHQFPRQLPGEFRTDRADCLVAIANTELDLQHKGGGWRKRLAEALEEYERLADSAAPGNDDKELKLAKARALLVRGKGHSQSGEGGRARSDLEAAQKAFGEPKRLAPEDRYRVAVAHAWLGQVVPEKEALHNVSAMFWLKDAVQEGFHHLPRLEREKGFERVRRAKETRKEYAELVQRLEARRPRPTVRPR